MALTKGLNNIIANVNNSSSSSSSSLTPTGGFSFTSGYNTGGSSSSSSSSSSSYSGSSGGYNISGGISNPAVSSQSYYSGGDATPNLGGSYSAGYSSDGTAHINKDSIGNYVDYSDGSQQAGYTTAKTNDNTYTDNNYSNTGSNASISNGLKSTQQSTAQKPTQSLNDFVDTAVDNAINQENNQQKASVDFANAMLRNTAAQDNNNLGNLNIALPNNDPLFSARQDIQKIMNEANTPENTQNNNQFEAERALTDWQWRNNQNPTTQNGITLPTRDQMLSIAGGLGLGRVGANNFVNSLYNYVETQPNEQNPIKLPNYNQTLQMTSGLGLNGLQATDFVNSLYKYAGVNPNTIQNISGPKNIQQMIDNSNAPENTQNNNQFEAERKLTDSQWRNNQSDNQLSPINLDTPLSKTEAMRYGIQSTIDQVNQENEVSKITNQSTPTNTNQNTGDLQLISDIRNGRTSYEQVYNDYFGNHYGSLYNRYLDLGMPEDQARQEAYVTTMRQANNRIYDLGYRPDYGNSDYFVPWLQPNGEYERDILNNLGSLINGIESTTGNNFYTNNASFDDRLMNMYWMGNEGRDDRLFYDLTSELAGNAYANQTKGTNYGTTPKITDLNDRENPSSWNTALQAAMNGSLTKDQILHFYDSKDSDLVIPEETAKYLASDSTHALQQLFLNNGQNIDRLETVSGTSEEYRKAMEAFLEANPALKLMVDNNVLSLDDIQMNFFRNVEFDDEENAKKNGYGSYSRSGYSRRGGGGGGRGGGGGGGGYSYGSSYGNSGNSSGATTKSQSDTRIHNIMKNWTF